MDHPHSVHVHGLIRCVLYLSLLSSCGRANSPAPRIVIVAPKNGEVISALPLVVSYNVIGADVVELHCDGVKKGQYDQERDDNRAITLIMTENSDAMRMGSGLYLSGMHSIVVTGRQTGNAGAWIMARVDFFIDMPEPQQLPHADGSVVEETGIGAVLLIATLPPPHDPHASLCLAGQYKKALEALGIFVHTRHEEYSDADLLAQTVEAHKPDLVLYIPELELMNGTHALAHLWHASHRLGIPTAVIIAHMLHAGLSIDVEDPLWQAGYVVSADPHALAHWPRRTSCSGARCVC